MCVCVRARVRESHVCMLIGVGACTYVLVHTSLPPSQSFCGKSWVANQKGHEKLPHPIKLFFTTGKLIGFVTGADMSLNTWVDSDGY